MPTLPTNTAREFDGEGYHYSEAWMACQELLLTVYRSSQSWTNVETRGLRSLARRAAFAAAANIGEGAARHGPAEFRRFLNNSLGSLSELSYTLIIARELRFITPEAWRELETMRDHASRLTWGLYWAVMKADG